MEWGHVMAGGRLHQAVVVPAAPLRGGLIELVIALGGVVLAASGG